MPIRTLILLAGACLLGSLAACQSGTTGEPAVPPTTAATPQAEPPTPQPATPQGAGAMPTTAAAQTSATAAPRATTPAPTAAAAPQTSAAGVSGISGAVIAASDVGGQPDQPLPGQLVVAIPIDLVGSLPGGPGGAPSDRDLRFLAVTVERQQNGVVTTLADAGGRYNLALAPGDYALCLADSSGAQPAGFPLTTRGCGRVAVQQGSVRAINISSGMGEIVLVEP